LEERDSGVAPPKIEARPLSVTLQGGAVLSLRGGYFPAVYEPGTGGWQNVGEMQAAEAVAGFLDPSFTRPGTQHSHLKKRAETFSAVVSLDPRVIQGHFLQVAHDLAFREAVKSAAGLLIDPRVQVEMNRALGRERTLQLVQWMKDVGQGRGAVPDVHSGGFGRFIQRARGSMALATMGYAADIAAGDISNIVTAAVFLKKQHWAAGLYEYGRHPKDSTAFALSKSGELRFRRERIADDFRQQVAAVGGQTPSVLVKHAWVFMEATDAATATPFWLGAYRQAVAEEKTDADAVLWADQQVRQNFPSHSVVDTSGILRGNGIASGLLFLHGFANTTYGVNRQILHQLYVALTGDEVGGERILKVAKVSSKVVGTLLGYWIAYGVVGELLSGRGPEDDDKNGETSLDEWTSWFWRKLALAPAYSVPFLAGPLESVAMGRQPSVRSAPAFSLADRLYRSIKRIFDADGEAGAKEWIDLGAAAVPVIATLAGVPAPPSVRPARALNYIQRAVSGEAGVEGPLDFLGGVIFDQRERQGLNLLEAASRAVEE
jgi:hypothetical protein